MSKNLVSYDFDGVIHTDVWLDQRGQYHPNTFTNYRKWMDNINYKIVRQIKKDYKKYDLVILTARSKKYYKYLKKFLKKTKLDKYFKKIICSSGKHKSSIINKLGIVKHYDDSPVVHHDILENCKNTKLVKVKVN